MGVVYFLIALATNLLLGLPLAPLSSVSAGVLQAIPFFGPFLSWAPPVIVALALQPSALLPTVVLMGIGWVVVMNVLQPRIMQDAVGIHPIVVLGSVLIGSRIAGIPGAIFGIPIAAVVSAFFFQYLHRASADRSVDGTRGPTCRRPRGPAGARPARARTRAAPRTSTIRTRRASPRERRHRPTRRRRPAPGRHGHDPRARPDGAPRPRQGTRRTAGRQRRSGTPPFAAHDRPAARRVDEPAAHPGHQRRRRRVARPARAQAGARPDGRRDGRRARTPTRARWATRRR